MGFSSPQLQHHPIITKHSAYRRDDPELSSASRTPSTH